MFPVMFGEKRRNSGFLFFFGGCCYISLTLTSALFAPSALVSVDFEQGDIIHCQNELWAPSKVGGLPAFPASTACLSQSGFGCTARDSQ